MIVESPRIAVGSEQMDLPTIPSRGNKAMTGAAPHYKARVVGAGGRMLLPC